MQDTPQQDGVSSEAPQVIQLQIVIAQTPEESNAAQPAENLQGTDLQKHSLQSQITQLNAEKDALANQLRVSEARAMASDTLLVERDDQISQYCELVAVLKERAEAAVSSVNQDLALRQCIAAAASQQALDREVSSIADNKKLSQALSWASLVFLENFMEILKDRA